MKKKGYPKFCFSITLTKKIFGIPNPITLTACMHYVAMEMATCQLTKQRFKPTLNKYSFNNSNNDHFCYATATFSLKLVPEKLSDDCQFFGQRMVSILIYDLKTRFLEPLSKK